jgi:hypothetical protein
MRFQSKPKPFLDPARRDWQFEACAWLLRNSDGYAKFAETPLVLPTLEFFPDRGMKGHAGVAALFRRVRDHAGMADWPCTVERAGETPEAAEQAPDGTRVFTYSRDSLDPIVLVANFACELARYLLSTFEEPVPGGDAAGGAAAEFAAVFMGFGIFVSNSAVRAASYRMNEGELAHALAMFCLLRGFPPESAEEHLNPHLRKHLRLAARDLEQYESRFQELRSTGAADERERALR